MNVRTTSVQTITSLHRRRVTEGGEWGFITKCWNE